MAEAGWDLETKYREISNPILIVDHHHPPNLRCYNLLKILDGINHLFSIETTVVIERYRQFSQSIFIFLIYTSQQL